METRVAIIAIIVEDSAAAESVNAILHEYKDAVIGRMGIPYKAKGINIISIAVDASQDDINSMAGKIGRIDGVSAKTVYSAN
jgi:putative iron-only hydrogenase system regulator